MAGSRRQQRFLRLAAAIRVGRLRCRGHRPGARCIHDFLVQYDLVSKD